MPWRDLLVARVVLTMLPRSRTGTNTATLGYDVVRGSSIPYNGRLGRLT